LDRTGRIHSFETFGTLDGPGIRFVAFLQGCPLRCLYCHNRDTWEPLGGREYTVDEVMREISRYTGYMKFSGGGVTVSGGEPLLQPSFVAELFRRCRESGIHTALDTSGFSGPDSLDGLLSCTDLVLLDIKHACDEAHREITGVGREKPAAFARRLSDLGIPVWIRYVLVPGYTDSEEDLKAAAAFIRTLRNVQKVEVLPYHSMGSYKWEQLGLEYPLAGVSPPDGQSIEKARRLLAE
jgi:pyruvate formate lyase activating enzyme